MTDQGELKMFCPVVIHEQNRGFAYPLNRNSIVIRARVQNKRALRCTLFYYSSFAKDVPVDCSSTVMDLYSQDDAFDYFEGVIVSANTICYLNYFFRIEYDNHATRWVSYFGISKNYPTSTRGLFQYQCANNGEAFNAPEWLYDAIIYQIFPERFFNGDTTNDPDDTEEWGSSPTRTNFMGGDLKGVNQKVHYLKELGVTAIYLNPIFESPSNHKYDTTNYYKIDSRFGDICDIKALVDNCHRNGIKVILDGVFNHCGYDLEQFKDVRINGTASEYSDWFFMNGNPIQTEPLNYECFAHYPLMPRLRVENPKVKEFIFSVAKYWMNKTNIDGWRLDVAEEIDQTFWSEFRRFIKQINPECVLIAEACKENADMLQGDRFDSLMNYVFSNAVADFFGKNSITGAEFNSRLNRYIGVYRGLAVKSQYNLIGCHDTPRFMSVCGEDVRKFKAAAAFQLCFIGVPAIYYGDEIGMMGGDDPDCRKCMEWDEQKQNIELLNFYKRIISLRKASPALSKGDFRCNYCSSDNGTYGFVRLFDDERVYVVINNSEHRSSISLPVFERHHDVRCLMDLLTEKELPVVPLKQDEIFFTQNGNIYNSAVNLDLDPYQVCIMTKT